MDDRTKCKLQNYKTPRGYLGENLDDLGYSDDFLDTTPMAQSMKDITNKLDLIKVFCYLKDIVKRMRRQAIERGKYFQKTYPFKKLSPPQSTKNS